MDKITFLLEIETTHPRPEQFTAELLRAIRVQYGKGITMQNLHCYEHHDNGDVVYRTYGDEEPVRDSEEWHQILQWLDAVAAKEASEQEEVDYGTRAEPRNS